MRASRPSPLLQAPRGFVKPRGVQARPVHIGPRRTQHAARMTGKQLCCKAKEVESQQEQTFNLPREDEPVWAGDYKAGEVVGGRYKMLEVLGQGSSGVTYKALDKESGNEVAVKALSLKRLSNWKQLELFEREAGTLASLSHPSIPRYIAHFEQDTQQDRAFFLVQELAVGKTLAELVEEGQRLDEAEVERIAQQLLAVAEYLGQKRPAVIHRDIKPQNILLQNGKPGGQVYLVDFGGVQAAAASQGSMPYASTIIGTYGYMAPEQFQGSASHASDLYSLGGTLLYLLTGRPPGDFPQERFRTDLSELKGTVGARMQAILEGLLDPHVEDRMTAAQALSVLRGEQDRALSSGSASSSSSSASSQLPSGSRIQCSRSGTNLVIDIPPAKLLAGERIGTASFAVAWNAFVAFWTVSAIASGGALFAAFSAPFWVAGVQLGKQAFGGSFQSERLELGWADTPGIRKRWRLAARLPSIRGGSVDWNSQATGKGSREAEGACSDLQGAQLVPLAEVNGELQCEVVLKEGTRRHQLGASLSLVEQRWLVQRINQHLESLGIETDGDDGLDLKRSARRRLRSNNILSATSDDFGMDPW
ncbi:hypothetical protein WJX74_010055 [Apatococcus lobatus]|uniref:non-specific serine/threonine protein kinase n=1 Tax=Apatococcus lobatus TaxID=904363 RepID=A0AAW1QM43_9CHLO